MTQVEGKMTDFVQQVTGLPRDEAFALQKKYYAEHGLTHLFDAVFHIHSFGYAPKPDPLGFQRMIDAHGMDPHTTAFFEDSERNLKPAKDLGMTTVLVGPRALASTAPFVDYRTAKLAPFLDQARLKKAA